MVLVETSYLEGKTNQGFRLGGAMPLQYSSGSFERSLFNSFKLGGEYLEIAINKVLGVTTPSKQRWLRLRRK